MGTLELYWIVYLKVMLTSFISVVNIGIFGTILKPCVVKFWHSFSSAQIGSKQLNLMTKTFYENSMFKGDKSCLKDPNVNQAIASRISTRICSTKFGFLTVIMTSPVIRHKWVVAKFINQSKAYQLLFSCISKTPW